MHKLHKAQMDTSAHSATSLNKLTITVIPLSRNQIVLNMDMPLHTITAQIQFYAPSYEYPYAINSSSNQKDLTWGRTDGFSNVLQL